jgi:polyhydroxyalkanoate synthesis regulator phasin
MEAAMAFVWDLIQQIQLHNTKSSAKAAREDAKSAELRARVAESKSRTAQSRVRDLETRVDDLEAELSEMRTTMAVLLDRLERRFGEPAPAVSGRIADSG